MKQVLISLSRWWEHNKVLVAAVFILLAMAAMGFIGGIFR